MSPKSRRAFEEALRAIEKFDYCDVKVTEKGADFSHLFDMAKYCAFRAAVAVKQFLALNKSLIIDNQDAQLLVIADELFAMTGGMADAPKNFQIEYAEMLGGESSAERISILMRRVGDLERLVSDQVSSIPTRIENAVTSSVAAFDQKLAGKQAEVDEAKSALLKVHDSSIIEIADKRDELLQLIGETTTLHLVKDYATAAAAEKKAADFFRISALVMMGAAVTLLGVVSYFYQIDFSNYALLLSKVLFTLALLIPVAYVARESAKHRAQFHKLRQTALDLGAVSPYLDSVEKPHRDKVKVDIASKIFVPAESKAEGDGLAINTHELLMKLMDKMEFSGKSSGKSS